MAVTWADVVALDAALDALPLEAQLAHLAAAELQCNETAWGDKRDLGITYLAAHLGTLTVRGSTGGAGPVTSESVGDVSRSYAAPLSSSTLESTVWGSQYRALARLLPAARVGFAV